MSSFKRRVPSKQVIPPTGTRSSPTSPSTILTSSGIPSLDDVLGGGLPLSCSLTVLAPDNHSAYGELVQKYFVAQGIASGHRVCIVDDDAQSFVKECMWLPSSTSNTPTPPLKTGDDDDDDEKAAQSADKIKIAWRYEQMKRFQTTVPSSNSSTDNFCCTFDLTSRIPLSAIDSAHSARRLIFLGGGRHCNKAPWFHGIIEQMQDALRAESSAADVVRFSIPSLGHPKWGDLRPTDILNFLHALRRLLRRYPQACACISLSGHTCTDAWGGPGWVQKVGWLTDASITLSGFGANPSLLALFPSHHGLLQIHKLPAPHTILPTSDKYSILRGLSSSAGANVGGGENNLAFKCMRKRLVFETMHLDLEGGVTERRTTPSSNTAALDDGLAATHEATEAVGMAERGGRVEVELEKSRETKLVNLSDAHAPAQSTFAANTAIVPAHSRKAKKKVAFQSDKPDLYDF
ncbi:PAXNEB-domain-containing protein [Phlebopus sp. FC_14]|nr:PAXNEB-domain-containing protein [Phlebopus sp. FC_14]